MHERSQQVREDYLAAVLEPDPDEARSVMRTAVREGLPLEAAFYDVLGPAMAEVGRRWERGEIGIAHEHLAAEVTASLVSELSSHVDAEEPTGRMAIVSCSPDERHCIAGHMLSSLLRTAGWEVLFLGATLPVEDIVSLAADEVADVVALSTTLPHNLPAVAETIHAVQQLEEPPLVLVGGQAYEDEDAARHVGADAYLSNAADAPALLRRRLPAA